MSTADWIADLRPPRALLESLPLGREPRVLWYPSAGDDFRDLLYLNEAWLGPCADDPAPPDLYLHTDYYPWDDSTFLDSRRVFDDGKTEVHVLDLAELAVPRLPVAPRLVDFPRGNVATGRGVFLRLRVTSTVLGTFERLVLYFFVENAAYCAKVLLPSAVRVTHLVNVRYGGGLGGGGKSSGRWMELVLGRLGVEVLISDARLERSGVYPSGYRSPAQDRIVPRGITRTPRLADDLRPLEVFPEPAEATADPEPLQLRLYRLLQSSSWSGHGSVGWYRVERTDHQPDLATLL